MRKTVNFQKWTFPFLTLLIVVVAAFSGEVFITTASPSATSVPTSCTLRNNLTGNRKLDVPGNIDPQVRADLLGSSSSSSSHISSLFSLQCKNASSSSSSSDAAINGPQTHTFVPFRSGPVTYNHSVSGKFNGGNGGDTQTQVLRDTVINSSYREITVNHPDQDSVVWDVSTLNLSNKTCTFATHPFENATAAPGLKFNLNGGNPTKDPTNDPLHPLQVVYSSQTGVTQIGLDFSGVSAGATVKFGSLFVGGNGC